MPIKIRQTDPLKMKTPCLVVGVFDNQFNTPLLKQLDQALDGLIRRARQAGEFAGKADETLSLPTRSALPAERVLLVGLGPRRQAGLEQLRRAAGTVAGQLRDTKMPSFACLLPQLPLGSASLADKVAAICEGLLLARYRFDRYLSKAQGTPPVEQTAWLLIERPRDKVDAEQAVAHATRLCRAVALARDLVNEPGNVKSPAYLAERAQAAAAEAGLLCTVLEKEALARDGFGALLGVAQGSVRDPHLIVLEHRGGTEDEQPVVLVGKGVVFDAGGISLKPAEKMDEMKMDMAGGAAVIGALYAAALLDLPINLVGIVPAVENLPSGSAIRPGDILTSLSGQTIEVLNTDAEGRLILADALTYAKRFEPRLVIDLATLTGACIIALGHQASAVLGNHEPLVKALVEAGEQCGERAWPLPLWDAYDEQIKSQVADVKNIGGRPAGTITAAAFLKRFAGDFKWAHLDIAGTAWLEQSRPYIPKGGTGVGVRLLLAFLQGLPNSRL